METLKRKITDLLGECEVERLKDGKYVVLYMNMLSPPPPKGTSEEEAMKLFIEWYEERRVELSPILPVLEEEIEDAASE